jgi:hypothetical protein
VQVFPQMTKSVGHTQSPPTHDSSPAQVFPHAPQLAVDEFVSAQIAPPIPLQSVRLPPQAQLPRSQCAPVGHTLPHPPQFWASPEVSMHVPPQASRPAGHTAPASTVFEGLAGFEPLQALAIAPKETRSARRQPRGFITDTPVGWRARRA